MYECQGCYNRFSIEELVKIFGRGRAITCCPVCDSQDVEPVSDKPEPELGEAPPPLDPRTEVLLLRSRVSALEAAQKDALLRLRILREAAATTHNRITAVLISLGTIEKYLVRQTGHDAVADLTLQVCRDAINTLKKTRENQ